MFFKKAKITFSLHSIQFGPTELKASLYQFLNNTSCQDQVLEHFKKGKHLHLYFTQDLCIEKAIISRITQICHARHHTLTLYTHSQKIALTSYSMTRNHVLLGGAVLILLINLWLDTQTTALKREIEKETTSQTCQKISIKNTNTRLVKSLQALLDLPLEIETLSLKQTQYAVSGFLEETQQEALESQLNVLEKLSTIPIKATVSQAQAPYLYVSLKGVYPWKS